MPTSSRPLTYGLVLGAIAYVAVALLYTVFDALTGRGFLFTVNQLGLAFISGLGETAGLETARAINVAAVAIYNLIHLVAALTIGVVVTRLVEEAHRRPDRAPTILLAIIAGFVLTIGFIGAATIEVRAALPWWTIIAANTVAVAGGGVFLLRRYPTVFRRLT
ncbi:MAG: hypothetical protein OEW77_11750 [Gemmatimonadota bacterium]|nr:hypothetical protein [Gemmatimonadota bacterium]